MSGSCGYPYKFDPYCKTKRDWLDRYSFRFFQDLDLASTVGQHYKPYYVWDCFPKIEILESEKAIKKTRLICGAPPELVFLQDACSGDLNDLIGQYPLQSKTAIGHNFFLGGWDHLSSLFTSSVDHSDAKQWDSSMSVAWLYYVYRIRERLTNLTFKQRKVLWFCFSELAHSILNLSDGSSWFVNGGNKSGSASTCHDNTIGHIFLIAYCFVKLGFSFKFFLNFYFVVMGDDLISESMPSGFWDLYRSFGVNVVEKSSRDIFGAEFLSHMFVKTAYGVMPCHKNNKMLFSSFSHDSKAWRSFRYQKLFLLYVMNFWHSTRDIYRHILDKYDIYYDDLEIIRFWSGLV